MLRNGPAMYLERFRYSPYEQTADILITTCPKTIFRVNPDLSQVIENVLVVFRDNRWQLVDGELYRDGVFVKGLLRADIYDCVDVSSNHFLLISTYPLTCDTTSWRESVLDVVDRARENWVTMKKAGNAYAAHIEKGISRYPRWPDQSMEDFVLEAFVGNVITADNLNDPLLSAYEPAQRNSRNRQAFIEDGF
ncbi:MAG: hypothetical protein ACXWTS_05890 [Methylococcaceae bacterium]